MSITVQLPSALQSEYGGAAELSLKAATVRAALDQLERDCPAIYRSVCDETGAVRRHIHLFVNNSFLHKCEGLDKALVPGDVLIIMPAVSGG